MKFRLTIAYDGTSYCGWQVQPNGTSVQALIQRALQTLLRHPIELTGSGRTDAGVHACGQTAHFETSTPLTHSQLISLNALLPLDIRILQIDPVSQDFHARYSAKSKIYHYHFHLDPVLDPFVRLYRYHVFGPLDVDLIKQATVYFLGTHDFTSFANQQDRGVASRDSVRTLKRIDLVEQKGGIRLEFEADGFLYKMVRNITGVLIEVGKRKMKPNAIEAIFASKDRRQAPMTAPAKGLFLMQVIY